MKTSKFNCPWCGKNLKIKLDARKEPDLHDDDLVCLPCNLFFSCAAPDDYYARDGDKTKTCIIYTDLNHSREECFRKMKLLAFQ